MNYLPGGSQLNTSNLSHLLSGETGAAHPLSPFQSWWSNLSVET